jgi:hypothetical protein
VALHAGLLAGATPAAALAAARVEAGDDPGRRAIAAAFVCIGVDGDG